MSAAGGVVGGLGAARSPLFVVAGCVFLRFHDVRKVDRAPDPMPNTRPDTQ